MKRTLIFSLLSLMLVLSLSAFQCSSTELTSAKLYIQQKNYDKAMEVLQKEITKNPKSDEGFYYLGYLHGEKGEYAKMIENFDKSLAISKKFEKNIEDFKRSYWASSFNKGVAFFNRATKVTAEDSIKMYYDKAISAFNDAVMIEPDSADTYKNLAFAHLQAGKQEEAASTLEKLLKVRKSADTYRLLGEIYTTQGLNLNTKYKESGNSADSVQAMERYNKAVAVLEEGRKAYPEDQEILYYLSNAYISANKMDVAMETFKAGVEQAPENQFYRYNYGTLLLQGNKFPEAEEQFKKAIEIDPEYHNAIYNLAVTYVKWGTTLREKADEQGTEDPEYRNKYNQALPLLKRVTELKPDDAAVWETLAKVYAVLGMTQESQEAFTKADQLR